MPAPTVLPGRAFQQVDPRSNLLFHWRASDMALTNVNRSSSGVFSRASAGGEVPEANGRLVGPAADGLEQFEFVDTDADDVRDAVALRLEGARTNLTVRSEELDTGSWAKTRLRVDPNSTIVAAPDGRFTADVVIPSTVNGTHTIKQTMTASSGEDYSMSAFFRAKELDQFRLYLVTGAGSTEIGGVIVDLDAGTTTNSTANGPTVSRKTLTSYADSWYRLAATVDMNSTDSTVQITFVPRSSTGGESWASNDADGIYAWGFQFEDSAAFATSYIPTAAAAVTRAAEGMYWPYPPKPQVMTVYVKVPNWVGGLINGTLWHIGAANNATDPRIILTTQSNGTLIANYDDGTTSAVTGTLAAPTDGDLVEIIVTLTTTGVVSMATSLNGAAVTTVATGAGGALPPTWAAQRLYLNSAGTATVGFGSYHSVKVAAGVKSMGFMRNAF